jgi:hypothetical protein
LRDAYPDLTQRGDLVKEALIHAAQEKLPEAEDQIKRSPKYVSSISPLVRHFCMFIVFVILN